MRRSALGLIAAVLAVVGGWLVWRGAGAARREPVIPGAGEGRVVVEVLNGTAVDGLARATTDRLRRAGFDVVYFGTAPADTYAITRVIARRGDSTRAKRVRDALGVGVVARDEDPRLLLDVSVILGLDAAGSADREP